MVEDDFFGKLGEARLDVTRGGGIVASEDITEVTLGVDEQVLLGELYEGVTDGGVAMRMVFHRVTHNVSHLVKTAVVEFIHRMQDTALHWLQAVLNGRHGTFEDDIRGIVEKPVLEHSFQWYHMVFILLSLSIFHAFQSLINGLLVQGFIFRLVFDIHKIFLLLAKIGKISLPEPQNQNFSEQSQQRNQREEFPLRGLVRHGLNKVGGGEVGGVEHGSHVEASLLELRLDVIALSENHLRLHTALVPCRNAVQSIVHEQVVKPCCRQVVVQIKIHLTIAHLGSGHQLEAAVFVGKKDLTVTFKTHVVQHQHLVCPDGI